MVIGHFGFGLGAKKFAPKISLGVLFMAVQWADLLWPTLLLLKVEHVRLQPDNKKFPFDFTDYPITHSLLFSLAWGFLFALIYWLVRKDWRSAVVLGICVVSHWALDLVVHAPDLPLFPGDSPKVGLGLWNWPVWTAVVEGLLFIVGLIMYLRTTVARNGRGRWGLWVLVILLMAGHLAGLFSPVPASVDAAAWSCQVMWLYILLGYWVDRNRESTRVVNQVVNRAVIA